MNKKVCTLFLCLALLLSFSGIALAAPGIDEEGVDGVYIDPIADMSLTPTQLDTGYPVDITGYVGFLTALNPAGNPTNPKLTSLKLEVQKDSEAYTQIDYTEGYSSPSTILASRSDVTGIEFNFTQPWIITQTGAYSLKVTAVFTQGGPYPAEYDTQTVTVTLDTPVIVEYPAAPAIAAEILQHNGIKPNYGKGMNYISEVAQNMTQGAMFEGEEKCINGQANDAYYDAVLKFLSDLTGHNLSDPRS